MTQPEPLRLADKLERHKTQYSETTYLKAAAELRRLQEENERLHQINQSHEMKLSVRGYEIQIADLEAQRDALLAKADDAHRWHDQQLDRAEKAEAECNVLRAQRDALLEALKSTGLFLHHCWCDVQMNDYSFDKLNQQMAVVDAAIKAVEGEKE